MFKMIAAISVGLLAFPLLGVPQGVAPRPKFEVASLEGVRAGQTKSSDPFPDLFRRAQPGLLESEDAHATGLRRFCGRKSDLQNPGDPWIPIEGLPNWVNSASYSIEAKTETPQSAAMMRGPMMQALLEERFDLKVHREKLEVPRI